MLNRKTETGRSATLVAYHTTKGISIYHNGKTVSKVPTPDLMKQFSREWFKGATERIRHVHSPAYMRSVGLEKNDNELVVVH